MEWAIDARIHLYYNGIQKNGGSYFGREKACYSFSEIYMRIEGYFHETADRHAGGGGSYCQGDKEDSKWDHAALSRICFGKYGHRRLI